MGIEFIQHSALVLSSTPDPVAVICNTARVTRSSLSPPDKEFVKDLLRKGHYSPFEFCDMTVKFRCSRAVANEMVRHRLASFMQESTRYVDYSKHIEFIIPTTLLETSLDTWKETCRSSLNGYLRLLGEGNTLEVARGALSLDLACTILVKANFREWAHIFKLRLNRAAHPDFQSLLFPLFRRLRHENPEIWGS